LPGRLHRHRHPARRREPNRLHHIGRSRGADHQRRPMAHEQIVAARFGIEAILSRSGHRAAHTWNVITHDLSTPGHSVYDDPELRFVTSEMRPDAGINPETKKR
jgi:hypothetical protein